MIIFILGLIVIVLSVVLMIFYLYTGYKTLKKHEKTEEAELSTLVAKKLNRAIFLACFSLGYGMDITGIKYTF